MKFSIVLTINDKEVATFTSDRIQNRAKAELEFHKISSVMWALVRNGLKK